MRRDTGLVCRFVVHLVCRFALRPAALEEGIFRCEVGRIEARGALDAGLVAIFQATQCSTRVPTALRDWGRSLPFSNARLEMLP